MFHSMWVRIAVILAIAATCGWRLYDNHLEIGSPVRLGLDLKGGMYVVMEVDDPDGTLTPDAREDAILRSRPIILNRVDELGVAEPTVQVVGGDRLIVELPHITDGNRARELIGRTAMLEWHLVRPARALESYLPRIDRAVSRSLATLPGSAIGDPTLAGPDGSIATAHPFSSLLLRAPTARDTGEFLVPAEDVDRVRAMLELPEVRAALPRDLTLGWGTEVGGEGSYRALFVLDRAPFLTGDMLEDARSGRHPEGNQPIVHFDLSRAGGRLFSQVTGRHLGDRLAILLDGEVVSAPSVEARIGSSGVIELNGAAMDEARDLALVLRAGALPAPLRIMEERTVESSLGEDAIERGRVAGLVGLALVVAIVVAYYRIAGVLAVGALAVYMLVLLGGLATIDRTLTLPGIAGIVLSIGMAVDANVLVFERVREELEAGRQGRAAVEAGFEHAFSAIVDASATTLITALVLFNLGTGPVRGFAVTLAVGIVASFFTAVYVTRTFILLYLLYLRAWRGRGSLSI